jgi:glycosyltransferase involved in cell wall biosynthesis
VVAEAMSYGLPVICLKNCGPGELTPPASALKVAYGTYSVTVKELTAKLQDLMFNPKLLETEKNLAYKHYTELFEWEVRGNMLKEVYATVLAPNSISKK